MATNKNQVAANNNALGLSGLNNASITGLSIWRHGIIDVVELTFTGSTATSPYYIKHRQGQSEIGGTPEWNTGIKP